MLLKNRKIFETTTALLLCPPGYKTESPYHNEFTMRWPCNVLCLHKNTQNFKPDKWYIICQENSCQSCNLDRMQNSKHSPEFVKLDSAAIA
uniref:Uncharacterized protein n=1 Tax=Romanomermis culicivorax TaxID=13658 RepID=A0A915KM81_ROMCU